MIVFDDLHISHREEALKHLSAWDLQGAENAFAGLYMWKDYFNTQIAFSGDFMYVKSSMPGRDCRFSIPKGNGDLKAAVQQLIAMCTPFGAPNSKPFGSPNNEPNDSPNSGPNDSRFTLFLEEASKERLEQLMPGVFTFEPIRAGFDYIYLTDDLVQLAGKKYHSKRNFVQRFDREQEGRWEFKTITPEMLPLIAEFNGNWYQTNTGGGAPEIKATANLFDNYTALECMGCALFVDGQMVAYEVGSRINSDMVGVHIEKANSAYVGAYQKINHLFATHFCQKFKYINREDDVGVEGLRKAKLSYHPYKLLSKYRANLAQI